jgi:acetyl esterase
MFDLHNQLDVIEKDVVYQTVAGLDLQCRIHMPAQPGKHPWPMLLDVHGGGWNRFDRTRDGPVDQQLAALGLVVASVDFRLNGQAPHPAAMQDIHSAIRWLKAHAADFDATPQGMGALGFSSGGHQVLMAGMRPHHAPYGSGDSGAHNAELAYLICSGCGYDLITAMTEPHPVAPHKHDHFNLYDYMGGVEGVRGESPLHVIQTQEALATPPLLLIQAGADVLPGFTNDKAAEFAQRYTQRGGEVELAILAGAPHIFINPGLMPDSEAMRRGLAMLKGFIARQLDYQAHPFTPPR